MSKKYAGGARNKSEEISRLISAIESRQHMILDCCRAIDAHTTELAKLRNQLAGLRAEVGYE